MENTLIDIELLFALMNGRVTAAINKRLSRDLTASGLEITSSDQWSILYSLWQKDGVRQKTIAENTFKDKPSITRLIDGMEAMGIVERRADRSDRRINKIFLTDKGHDIMQNVRKVSLETMQKVLDGVSETELQNTQVALRKIFKNLQSIQ